MDCLVNGVMLLVRSLHEKSTSKSFNEHCNNITAIIIIVIMVKRRGDWKITGNRRCQVFLDDFFIRSRQSIHQYRQQRLEWCRTWRNPYRHDAQKIFPLRQHTITFLDCPSDLNTRCVLYSNGSQFQRRLTTTQVKAGSPYSPRNEQGPRIYIWVNEWVHLYTCSVTHSPLIAGYHLSRIQISYDSTR